MHQFPFTIKHFKMSSACLRNSYNGFYWHMQPLSRDPVYDPGDGSFRADKHYVTSANNYRDVIMSAMASQTTASRLFTQTFVQTKTKTHQSSASLAYVRGIHRWPENSPHKGPVTRICWCHHVKLDGQHPCRIFIFMDLAAERINISDKINYSFDWRLVCNKLYRFKSRIVEKAAQQDTIAVHADSSIQSINTIM